MLAVEGADGLASTCKAIPEETHVWLAPMPVCLDEFNFTDNLLRDFIIRIVLQPLPMLLFCVYRTFVEPASVLHKRQRQCVNG